jgi:hypothetical protein
MLLWLLNLDFAGGDVVFFISGEIPIEAVQANIVAQYEARIIAPYEAQIDVESDGEVSI